VHEKLSCLLVCLVLFGCSNDPGNDGAVTPTEIDASPQTAVRVQVAPVERERLEPGDNLTAVVSADTSAVLRAEVPGRVVKRIAERGDRVKTNAPLLQLDPSRLELGLRRAKANLAAAEAELRQASRSLARGMKLKKGNTISEARADDLETQVERARAKVSLNRATRDTAARDLEDATLRAPFAGIVEEWSVDVGDFVQPGAALATLVDLDRVRLRAGVTAAQAAGLRPGQTTEILFSHLGSQSRTARLKSVGVVADSATGTYDIELLLDNPTGELREGMVARIKLPASQGPLASTVPREALLKTPLGMGVFIVEGEASPRARLQIVSVGATSGNRAALLDGVSEDDVVVIDGHFALSDGDAVILDTVGVE